MIYDGFMFFNEFDLLEIRLHELSDLVDKFILVESDITFSGKPKPLYFDENKGRYSDFLDRIVHVKVLDTPSTGDPWVREAFHRNQVMRGIPSSVPGTDILISCDLDEIPRASAVRGALPLGEIMALEMNSYGQYLNAYTGIWFHAKLGPISEFRKSAPHPIRHLAHKRISNAGWHFSYLGGPDRISQKMTAFAHQEPSIQRFNNPQKIRERMSAGIGLFGGKMEFRKLDDSFPSYVLSNRDRFAHLIGSA